MKNEMKRIIPACGRLGNQMFFYAFYKKLMKEYPNEYFVMDLSDICDSTFENNQELFWVFPNLNIEEATDRDIWNIERKIVNYYRGKGSKLVRRIIDGINSKTTKNNNSKICLEANFIDGMSENEIREYSIFIGFWQDVDYYIPYLEELRNHDFVFSTVKDELNKQYIERMANQNSVSVHIRRTDYVDEVLDVLSTGYYKRIIERIIEEEKDPVFYFFSDDLKYIEREYDWLKNKVIISHNQKKEDCFRDMQLMSMCKINVIANSSFSLWASLLNQRKDAKVYYPSHYTQDIQWKDIGLEHYIKVPISHEYDDIGKKKL